MYLTSTSVVIQYTTADCVIPENLIIELNIDVKYSKINPSSVVSYKSNKTDQFTVLGLESNTDLTYTLQVNSFLTIGMIHTGSFTMTFSTIVTTASTTRSTSSGILYSEH